MKYEDQLAAARYRAERDQARQELARLRDEMEAMRPRLMPEGYEWPRYETGELVRIGNEVHIENEKPYANFDMLLESITISSSGFSLTGADCEYVEFGAGERVKRPAPKVYDANGEEIREGGDAWWICEGDERGIHAERLRGEAIGPDGLVECSSYNGGTWVYLEQSELCINKPVIAADGKPLREGQTVWSVDSGTRYTVEKITDELIPIKCRSEMGSTVSLHPSQLTHERPDSLEQLEKDANDLIYDIGFHLGDYSPSDFEEKGDSVQDRVRDLVRRCKALAERGE